MRKYGLVLFILFFMSPSLLHSQLLPVVPSDQRGTSDAERMGTHDANNIATRFWNYGMVGDFYSIDPANVNLAEFHSVEVGGTGMNYSDGITPFVLAKVKQNSGSTAYIMETGYREGQGTSVVFNRIMRFEPRPGYFQKDPGINTLRSVAISSEPKTWPPTWPDKDASWNGRWNGYFGTSTAFAPDQESYTVMDDQFYDSWDYTPDNRDATRHGLGMKIAVRGFQWATPQAGDVIFWHYDVTNESTTDYPQSGSPENIIFGLYMDSGVGGSAQGCDPVPESDDDNAFFNRTNSLGLNLVYTWDTYGHGVDLVSKCSRTGYLGYAYLETPGKSLDGIDNDGDGIIDESRSSGPGQKIVGQQNIIAYLQSHPEKYNLSAFEAYYGKITDRPAYKAGVWWTGDEDMDWVASLNDFGQDGEPNTHDIGEGDGIPTEGEQNFDGTDLHESDQIGLTGFRMWKIGSTQGLPTDGGITFYDNGKQNYPQLFYNFFTNSSPLARFDTAVANNYNVGFLFASGPFTLKAGTQERFSLALAFGWDLNELINTTKVVQAIYNGNYKFATPPPVPTLSAEAGDGYVQLRWDDVAEHSTDPTTGINDFEGYKVYRSTDYQFKDVNTVISARGISQTSNGNPMAQFDLKDGIDGYSTQVVNGLAFYLGTETGLQHSFRDTTVVDGQQYFYAVTSYDFGATIIQGLSGEAFTFYPAENSISVSRTLLGGISLPKNVVAVRPNPRVLGYQPAGTSAITKISGTGIGTVSVKVLSSSLVPADHIMKITFNTSPDSVHPLSYNLIDSTDGDKVIFSTGNDFDALGNGISGLGIQPVVKTLQTYQVDTAHTGFAFGSPTNAQLDIGYMGTWPVNFKRTGFPNSFTITFADSTIDTTYSEHWYDPIIPVKFTIIAHTENGDKKLKFTFFDSNNDSTLSYSSNAEEIDILTGDDSVAADQRLTWRVRLKNATASTKTPGKGDVYEFKTILPFSWNDVFVFKSSALLVDPNSAKQQFKQGPYVVPNPYVGAASFEPAPFEVQGRGDRRMEFRNLPRSCVIRIYTVRGDLVRTLTHDGSVEGFVAWDLRTKDNLDVAPGLYIYQVDGGTAGTSIGKFAIIK